MKETKKLRKAVIRATDIHEGIVEIEASANDKAIDLLVACVGLYKLCQDQPDAYEEVRRGFMVPKVHQRTYRTAEYETRKIVKVVLRSAKAPVVSKYTKALAYIINGSQSQLSNTNLGDYICQQGGVIACTRAWQNQLREDKPVREPEEHGDEDEDQEAGWTGLRWHGPPPGRNLAVVIDAEGFIHAVENDQAQDVIEQVLARRTK